MAERVRITGGNNEGLTNEGLDAQVSTSHELWTESHLHGWDGIGWAKVGIDANGALKFTTSPSTLQERFDYDGRDDSQPVYAGFAARSVASSASSWTIHKFTYDGNGFVTLKQTAFDSWDNRVGASYG